MLSHLFVGGSHFGALTGAEIAGKDGGALGSSSELSLSDRKGCRGGVRVGPCSTGLWGRALAFPCFPLLCCCQGRPLSRDHSSGFLKWNISMRHSVPISRPSWAPEIQESKDGSSWTITSLRLSVLLFTYSLYGWDQNT